MNTQKTLLVSSLAGIVSTPIAVAVISGSVNTLLMSIVVELLIVITVVLVYILLNYLIPSYGGYKSRPFLAQGNQERLIQIINSAQDRTGVLLSWGAKEMLIIPVIEAMELKGYIDWWEVEQSIDMLINTLESHDYSDNERDDRNYRSQFKRRSSISMIRAFYSNFCNIPPFCDRR